MFSKRDILKSSVKLRRKKKFDAFSIFLCAFLFIVTSLAGLSQINKFIIKNIKISGEKRVERILLERAILKEISGRYFGLFPKNNAFIYPKSRIIKSFKDISLTVNSVSVALLGLDTININVEERQAAYLWCEEGGLACYYMDQDGLIFDKAPGFSGGVFFRFEGELPSGEAPSYYIGKSVLSSENIKMLAIFKQRAEEIVKKNFSDKWKASSYLLREGDDLELYFENGEVGKWKIMLAPRKEEEYSFKGGDAGSVLKTEKEIPWAGFGADLKQAEINLDTTLSSAAFKESAKGVLDPLQNLGYIDLRFGKKIFYKFN